MKVLEVMINKEKIVVIITGGTIDSYYAGSKDTVIPLKKSVIPSFIKSIQIEDPVSFIEVCMKDSRSLNANDLKKILSTINKTDSRKIIITHGTYTMPDTARFLAANLKKKNQTIYQARVNRKNKLLWKKDNDCLIGFSFSSLSESSAQRRITLGLKKFRR